MIIEWNITKERGNLRPVLRYRVLLEEHEKELAIPGVSIESTIPRPEDDSQKYCYPGRLERKEGYTPQQFYTLEAPSHRGYSALTTLVLPWRADNAYPEVEFSFERLRSAVEREITAACASEPMDVKGHVRASAEGKAAIAPAVAAARLLRMAAAASAARHTA